ncbi:DUF3224 domain-containing protein [Umezawaea endophytica]|uniref:DUF3224 domain-containing protein n=1 Tax=Umezawaea endophytica TaxID=1654476 RepID=A0A9X2VNJ5_9PSEU|nr:DUF3224 domain-containing protein [Umezawaea endophytica]MCS7479780.1 DUF3224 domain-containing protein [Umezawaea endophytica]
MTTQVKATFTITRWDEAAYETGEPKLARVDVGKTFTGPLQGTSTAQLLTCASSDGSAGYVASEQVTGTLDGHTGTFVLQHGATMSPTGPNFFGHVVPGSGTGDLTGLTGTARVEHELITLDYDLA